MCTQRGSRELLHPAAGCGSVAMASARGLTKGRGNATACAGRRVEVPRIPMVRERDREGECDREQKTNRDLRNVLLPLVRHLLLVLLMLLQISSAAAVAAAAAFTPTHTHTDTRARLRFSGSGSWIERVAPPSVRPGCQQIGVERVRRAAPLPS